MTRDLCGNVNLINSGLIGFKLGKIYVIVRSQRSYTFYSGFCSFMFTPHSFVVVFIKFVHTYGRIPVNFPQQFRKSVFLFP